MPYTGTPRTWVSGETVTAALMNSDVRDPLNGLAAAWAAYTPTIGGTGWAIGNGTATGAYAQVGKTVLFEFQVTWGTTSTFGAGQLLVSTPTSKASTSNIPFATVYVHSGASYPGMGQLLAGTTQLIMYNNAAPLASVISTVPFTWASGDIVRANGSYQSL